MGNIRKCVTVKVKLEAVSYAKEYSVAAAARKYNVSDKSVRSWRKDEARLKEMTQAGRRSRVSGGGRKEKLPQLEERVFNYFRSKRDRKLRVTRSQLQKKALELHGDLVADGTIPSESDFSASDGWMTRFMARHKISFRRVTTTCQKPPEDYIDKIIDFILYVRKIIADKKINLRDVYACDETAVWLDATSGTTLTDKGAKDVAARTTGHEKMRITVMLCGKADGTKCKPFILLPRKRPIADLVKNYGNRASLQFKGTTWMNQELTTNFLHAVIGGTVFRRTRLLVWGSFRPHISKDTKEQLKKLSMLSAVVPGGCTKYVQAPDVSWNAPFKAKLRALYDEWMEAGQGTLTAAGNPRAPPLEDVVAWVMQVWEAITPETIKKSFKSCGITDVTDGSEDDMIVCMQEGRDCAAGRQRLADKLANGSVPVLAVDDSADEMEEEEEEMVSDDDGSEGHVVTLSDNDDSDE